VVETWCSLIPDKNVLRLLGRRFPSSWPTVTRSFGIAVEGYWCDVGSRESYVDVTGTFLTGSERIRSGVHAREGLWAPKREDRRIRHACEGVVIGDNVDDLIASVVCP